MDCRDFKANLMEYIEEDINISLNSHMEEHMNSCPACRELYNLRVQYRKDMEAALDKSKMDFQSRSTAVMGVIDRNRYGQGTLKRMRYYLLENRGLYGTLAVVMVLAVLLGPGVLERYKNWRTASNRPSTYVEAKKEDTAAIVEENLRRITGKPSAASNPYDYIKLNQEDYDRIISLGKPAADYMLEQFASTDSNGLKESIMAIACREILHDNTYVLWNSGRDWYNSYVSRQKSSGSELNPSGDGICLNTKGVKRESLVQMFREMKEMSPGVGYWKLLYSSSNRMVFCNYRHLIVYDNTPENKGIFRILDFEPLSVGYYQGSSVVRFNVSPDGSKCIIGNTTADTDEKLKDMYLYDIENNAVNKIDAEVNMNSNEKWSADSEYFIYNKASDTRIYDTKNMRFMSSMPSNEQFAERKYPYISEQSGSSCTVAFDSSRSVEVKTEYTGEWGMKDSGTIIGVAIVPGENVKLGDFQIVEYDINNKSAKVVFKP